MAPGSGVDLDGMFLVAQAVGSVMVESGSGGSIIQTASVYAAYAADNRIYEGARWGERRKKPRLPAR